MILEAAFSAASGTPSPSIVNSLDLRLLLTGTKSGVSRAGAGESITSFFTVSKLIYGKTRFEEENPRSITDSALAF